MADSEEDSEEERGAVCPFCKKRNIVYEGETCSHYGGYFNVDEGYWEFDRAVMKKIGEKIQAEFEAFEKRLEELEELLSGKKGPNSAKLEKEQTKLQELVNDGEGLGKYQTERLKAIVPKAKYAEDEEQIAVGPKDFACCSMIFLNKAGQEQAEKHLKSK